MIISWEKRRHLSLRSAPSLGLYLNVVAMWNGLQKALTKYAEVLEGDPKVAGSLAQRSVTALSDYSAALEAATVSSNGAERRGLMIAAIYARKERPRSEDDHEARRIHEG